MSSEPTKAPPVGTVAQDAHAEERLREIPTEIDGGAHGRILTLDHEDEEFAIVAYVNHGADAGALHEGFAAVFQHALDEIPLSRAKDGGKR